MSDGDPVAAGDNSAALARIEQRLIELEAAALRSAARAEQQHQTVTEWFGHAAQALEALGNHSQSTARSVSILQQLTKTGQRAVQEQLDSRVLGLLTTIAREDAENRRRLWVVRGHSDYEAPFTADAPLISVVVPTGGRPEALRDTVLPSILRQEYTRLEVIVVGYALGPVTGRAVASIADERVAYVNLDRHLVDGDDYQRELTVMAANEGIRRAMGDWVLTFSDREAINPGALEALLNAARAQRAEVAYGRVRNVSQDPARPGSELIGQFPPKPGLFSLTTALRHRALRFFDLQTFTRMTGQGAEDFLTEAMIQAGVRFTAIPDAIFDRAVLPQS